MLAGLGWWLWLRFAGWFVCSELVPVRRLPERCHSSAVKAPKPEQLNEPIGVGVDQQTGEVYVSELYNNRVSKFSGSGEFELAWGWSVIPPLIEGSPPANEFQICTTASSCQKGAGAKQAETGSAPAGEFAQECGAQSVAVDNDPTSTSYKDVYVEDFCDNRVQKFSPSGKFLLMFGGHVNATKDGVTGATEAEKDVCEAGENCTFGTEGAGNGEFMWSGYASTIAVGSDGSVYVGDKARIEVFNSSGAWSRNISLTGLSTAGVTALAVDGASDLFVKDGEASGVREFEPDGVEKTTQFDKGSEIVEDLAVDGSGDLFVGDATDGFHVLEYAPNGDEIASFGSKLITSSHGMAVANISGGPDELYVAGYSEEGPKVWVLTPPAGPVVETGSESAIPAPRGVATLEAKINPQGTTTTYHFEYGLTSSYGSSTPSLPIGSTTSFEEQVVSSELSGLVPGDLYHYRVVVGSTVGSDETFTETPPMLVSGPWVEDVASTSASFEAEVDPLGTSTDYRLEYGTTSSYGMTLSGSLGDGSNYVLVSYHRQELQPNTIYHYKLTVSNAYGTSESIDHTFTTQPVGGNELALPDGRVWELVSPPNKQFGLIRLSPGAEQSASSDGSAVEFNVEGALGEDPVGYKGEESSALSVRGQDGWHTQNISLPQGRPKDGPELVEKGGSYQRFSTDLSRAIAIPGIDTVLAPGGVPGTLYFRNNENSSFTPILTLANVPIGSSFEAEGGNIALQLVGTTPDLSHIMLATSLALTPEAVSGQIGSDNLYEWSDGELQLVNVLPNGGTAQASGATTYLAPQGNIFGTDGGESERSISGDGRFVAWTWGSPNTAIVGQCSPEGYRGLYVRDMLAKETFRVGGKCAFFRAMSSDGERLFYNENGELYEYNTGTHASTDVTVDHGAGEANAGVQLGTSDISEDGSSVYFVAKGVLANGAVSGEDNLYLLHYSGGEWSTSYIATLAGEDQKTWYTPVDSTISLPDLTKVASRVSPDGRYLAFMSERSLTGYDNIDAVSGKPDEEVYLYDAVEHRTICASCDPTGSRPVGISDKEPTPLVDPGSIWAEAYHSAHWLAGNLPTWVGGGHQPRYLSNSGRLFFDSPEALVPQDTNGLEDPYEYEPVGVGDCTSGNVTFSERSDGCVNLISSGTSSSESVFLDASENGDDAFFITANHLTSSDYDTAYDIYDAHVCSEAVPCVSNPVSSPPCTSGDSCKAAPSPQPEVFGPTPSATFSGIGNVIEEAKPAVAPKSLTRAQKLARALDACHIDKRKNKRDACEGRARKRYPVKHSKVKASKKGGSR